jgi:uncharacterized tellurite resistance protein B-like protein
MSRAEEQATAPSSAAYHQQLTMSLQDQPRVSLTMMMWEAVIATAVAPCKSRKKIITLH